MRHKLSLKESQWSSDEQFSSKYFLNIAFVREISPKLSGGFGCYRHEWVKLFTSGVHAESDNLEQTSTTEVISEICLLLGDCET